MPALPQPYEMRDWKQVAACYDSIVFDLNRSGLYMPLIWTQSSGVNYPQHERFGIHSYVGTNNTSAAEAITVIPAVVGATLAGVRKSDQNGQNWPLLCEDFFNKRPQENVYLNNFVTSSGNDWWYDTMPNVFFYQLADLYPETGEFENQFISVADRWLQAVEKMGGDDTPWKKPYMNYRAWKLSTMEPLASGVRQPEAAGAIAWILYSAYQKTGMDKYRVGAEWCLEFLDNWSSNPAYELQLPYGVYTAARLNAEQGTKYDIQKMLDWCFSADGNVRSWGVTLGNWGGFDCYGLVGEALTDGYAFAMNGFQMAAALVPMVRYDDRYARAIGKWMLNLANASRLFYTHYLPDYNQDSENWGHQYDSSSCIAHESLREFGLGGGVSPFATGDAIRGGWAQTNYALYGAGHVGYLAGIVDTTNVPAILQLDLNKTDFYQLGSFPSFLYYNPHPESKKVAVEAGWGIYDFYDAVQNQMIVENASGIDSIEIAADQAVLLVLLPPDGEQEIRGNQLLVNGRIADYNAGQTIDNYPPRIKSLAAKTEQVMLGDTVFVYCTAEDPDQSTLSYQWTASGGKLLGEGATVQWIAGSNSGEITISCNVTDNQEAADSDTVIVHILDNRSPSIKSMQAEPAETLPDEIVNIQCTADDPDSDQLTYFWTAAAGSISGSGSSIQWQAPDQTGYFFIHCLVDDGKGGFGRDSIGIVVGDLVCSFPFQKQVEETSPFNQPFTVSGGEASTDFLGRENEAYHFDGEDDFILVKNHETLNFVKSISVHFWIKVDEFFDREAYPISHGNWENRWKISITNKRIRWTVKSTTGIKDLDSQSELALDRFYQVVCSYDGSNYDIYIDGKNDAHSTFSGDILTTSLDLTIGQVLPNNNQYNFKGTLDEIAIYNRALSAAEVEALFDSYTGMESPGLAAVPKGYFLYPNYPNPFNPQTTIHFDLPEAGEVLIEVYALNGSLVSVLTDRQYNAGRHSLSWDAAGLASGVYFYRLVSRKYQAVQKCLKLK